jgi:hypothetical protein
MFEQLKRQQRQLPITMFFFQENTSSTWVLRNQLLELNQSHPLRLRLGWPPFVDDFAGHPVLPTHLPDRLINVIGRSYTHAHTLPHPKWHKTKYTNFMAMNKQREMRFI